MGGQYQILRRQLPGEAAFHEARHIGERDRLAESLVVVTSDHGESLGEHGEATHSLFVYEGVLHVPLLFSHASLPAGAVVEAPTSTVDIHPTVLELLEVPGPGVAAPACSLAAALRGAALEPRPVYFESLYARLNYGWAELQGVREGDLKLIRAPRPELYDIAADPGETTNIAATAPLAQLRAELIKGALNLGLDLRGLESPANGVKVLGGPGFGLQVTGAPVPSMALDPPKSRV